MMLTKQYILKCLDQHCDFSELTEETFVSKIVDPLTANECFKNWSWDNGVTKGVLIFKDLDFVVKIPFEGMFYFTESHYVDAQGRWRYSDEVMSTEEMANWKKIDADDEFVKFEGANANDSDWNYCALEAELTKQAKVEDLDFCFAATEFLGYAKDHPIYIQEKCCMFSDASSTTNKEKYSNRTKSDYDSLRQVREEVRFWEVDDNWVLDFLIYWGQKILERLADFIEKYDIEDLHNGNIGYRNGVPCLVDYSSFHE